MTEENKEIENKYDIHVVAHRFSKEDLWDAWNPFLAWG